ncbi:phosphosulfolactate synthase [Zhaonella formicivorans]|uniref:phosphosulfolactate synthase n=1 Tax=Zhaonella formicivorans TaxID=2528593 RepID=UPI0010D7BD95|nr:phosphosulfolactate synthase [Zhaonella formicivorans]
MRDKERFSSWREVLDFPLGGRNSKPRVKGITMVIDKGLGLTETRELLEMAADYIDLIKLGFGTSALYSAKLLQEKIKLVKSYGVDIFPGGTFLEVAVLQGKLDLYLQKSRELGYTFMEVSDGTIEMSPEFRAECILKAQQAGFTVISEVGKKDSRDTVASSELHRQIRDDLALGVYKVIVEGRESGKGVVIYDKEGAIKEQELQDMLKIIPDLNAILWEAPLKNQQQELIMRFGPNVNIGNVAPGDIMSLEALRVGLRGDTLRAAIIAQKAMEAEKSGKDEAGNAVAR